MKEESNIKPKKEDVISFPFYNGTLQIFDVMQMVDIERCYKQNCMASIQRYKNWQKKYQQETDLIALIYLQLEGDLLRRQAWDFINVYWRVRNDYRTAFANYLKQNRVYKEPSLTVVNSKKQSVN
jgi:hypothetical protein